MTARRTPRPPIRFQLLLSMMAALVSACDRAPVRVDLSPEHWPPELLEALWQQNRGAGSPSPEVQSSRGMVAATSEPVAVHAGVEALRQGGTAIDALLTTSMTQIVLQAGSGVSFAGQMTLLYYEAASGQVFGVDGSFDTVRGETEPLSIPTVDSVSGRAVLVPGLMSGFDAAHRRFGKLPLAALLQPAIWFAERGFMVDSRMARRLRTRSERLTALPVARRTFSRPDGTLLQEGDTLRQPELARTLAQVASQGVAYLYQGDWARELAATVQSHGGRLTVEDLQAYAPVWSEPVITSFRDHYTIAAPGQPSFGGVSMAEAFNVLELADLPRIGHYRESPAALATMLNVAQVGEMLGQPMAGAPVPPEVLRRHFPGVDLSPAARTSKEHARMLWSRMQSPDWLSFRADAIAGRRRGSAMIEKLLTGWGRRRPQHTAGVVAVDSAGNVAVVMHSINSSFWGTGIMVGGIAIPDPGGFQQYLIASVGPGAKLPEPDNPLIVLRDGKPVLASSCIGAGLHEVAIQGVIDVLDFGMAPAQAVLMPALRKNWPLDKPLRMPVGDKGFPDSTLRGLTERGFAIEALSGSEGLSLAGYWVAVAIDPATRRIVSGITPGFNGAAEGY